MLLFHNDDVPVEWVIGQIDARGGRSGRGRFSESQGISHFKYQNGVHGLLVTGYEAGLGGGYCSGLIGAKGVIEVMPSREIAWRMRGKGQSEWEVLETEGGHSPEDFKLAVLDMIDALKEGRAQNLKVVLSVEA